MQGIPDQLHVELPQYLPQATDTATPRSPIPIYYYHTEEQPFCTNVHCVCQRGKRAGAALYSHLISGTMLLAQVTARTEKVTVIIEQGIPEDCQLYGHTWQITEHPDVKECSQCGVRGYCPGCTPTQPAGAKPFCCTYHAGRQVQQ